MLITVTITAPGPTHSGLSGLCRATFFIKDSRIALSAKGSEADARLPAAPERPLSGKWTLRCGSRRNQRAPALIARPSRIRFGKAALKFGSASCRALQSSKSFMKRSPS